MALARARAKAADGRGGPDTAIRPNMGTIWLRIMDYVCVYVRVRVCVCACVCVSCVSVFVCVRAHFFYFGTVVRLHTYKLECITREWQVELFCQIYRYYIDLGSQ